MMGNHGTEEREKLRAWKGPGFWDREGSACKVQY